MGGSSASASGRQTAGKGDLDQGGEGGLGSWTSSSSGHGAEPADMDGEGIWAAHATTLPSAQGSLLCERRSTAEPMQVRRPGGWSGGGRAGQLVGLPREIPSAQPPGQGIRTRGSTDKTDPTRRGRGVVGGGHEAPTSATRGRTAQGWGPGAACRRESVVGAGLGAQRRGLGETCKRRRPWRPTKLRCRRSEQEGWLPHSMLGTGGASRTRPVSQNLVIAPCADLTGDGSSACGDRR